MGFQASMTDNISVNVFEPERIKVTSDVDVASGPVPKEHTHV